MERAKNEYSGELGDWRSNEKDIEAYEKRHADEIGKLILGPPQPTKRYTASELEEMGFSGVYVKAKS